MIEEILHRTFLGNRILDYVFASLLFVGGLLVIWVARKIVLRRIQKWTARTKTTVDDFLLSMVQKTLLPLLYFCAFYIASQSLTLNPAIRKAIFGLGVVLLTILVIRSLVATLRFAILEYWIGRQPDRQPLEGKLKGLMPVMNVIIWGVGIVFLLDNLGFKISAVVAGLGIGGVAVALAAQSVLGDLFSYFSILFDRPFQIGDFVIVGDYLGVVEHIGIKTTRIRSLGGEILVFSNTDLTNSRVRNYKQMAQRRVSFRLGVTYQTMLERVKEIPALIKTIIDETPNTRFDRAHFSSYGDFSLIYEVVYYVLSGDYNLYMDAQQVINFAIKEEFEKRGVEFAYPTQTLFMTKS